MRILPYLLSTTSVLGGTLAAQGAAVGPNERPLLSWRGEGSGPLPGFGYSLAAAGDCDGDGIGDVVVGAPYEGPLAQGRARVFSGADGSLLHTFFDPGGWHFGFAVAGVGDIDGDGRDDVCVGDPMYGNDQLGGPGRLHVFSGRTGAQLRFAAGDNPSDELGASVAGIGDVDGDGVPDFAAGATEDHDLAPGPGYVRLYSGATGAILRTHTTSGTGKRYGQALVGLGDVNGDGVPDLLIGASGGAGLVQARSGATGGLLWQRVGSGSFTFLGWSLDRAGDVDGDGVADVIVGAPGAGYARIYRASDGLLVHEVQGPAGDFFGGAVAGLGDVDGDGRADFAIGAKWADAFWSPSTGAAWIYSSATYTPLRAFFGTRNGDRLGIALAALDDLDLDGVRELALGASQDVNSGPGFALVQRGRR